MNAWLVTANRLGDGRVVYYAGKDTGNNVWHADLQRAHLVTSEQVAAQLLSEARQDEHRNVVVGAYLLQVEQTPTGLRPCQLRERMRIRHTLSSHTFSQPTSEAQHVSL